MGKTAEIFQTEREKLFDRLADRLETAYNLNRKVVSFQANKEEPVYRWFKYKEGFSSTLVKYFLSEYAPKAGKVLDPFAGAGTTLFAGQELGWESYGIELLPVGVFVMQTLQALNEIDVNQLRNTSKKVWADTAKLKDHQKHINHISITRDAFSDEIEEYLNKYLTYTSKIKDKHIQTTQYADRDFAHWSYEAKTSGGKSKILSLDGRLELSEIKNAQLKERLLNWLNKYCEDLSIPSVPPNGIVFEVRQGYKSKDSKRQNADIDNATVAWANGYLPVFAIFSSQIDSDIVLRYRNSRCGVMIGSNSPNSNISLFAFCSDILGYDLAGFSRTIPPH